VGAVFVYTIGMRVLMFALVLISLCGLPARAQGIDSVISNKIRDANYEAIRIMKMYSKSPSNNFEYREIAKRMANLLEKAPIAPADNRTLKKCLSDPKMEAGTGQISQIISICPKGLSLNIDELIQTLIHESYHLYEGKYYYPNYNPTLYKKLLEDGEMTQIEAKDSERRATTMEIDIMQQTYGCVFSTSTYFKQLLGLTENNGYTICK
jgi:hypothetical protein